MIFVFTLLISCVLVIYYFYNKTFYYWKNLGVVQFPFSIKKGNLDGVGTKIHLSEFVINYYKKTKNLGLKFSGLYFSSHRELMIADLNLIKLILVKNFDHFANHGRYVNEKDEPLSAHLFNLADDDWKNMRQKISPVFTTAKLKMMFNTICDVADSLLSVIDDRIALSGRIEAKDTFSRFTTDTIGSVIFGIDCNSLRNETSKFFEMSKKIFAIRRSRLGNFIRYNLPNLSKKLHIKSLPNEVSEFYLDIAKKIIEHRENNPTVNRQDFMKVLVDLKQQGVLTVEQIAAQSYLFFLAGYDAISSVMTFCMVELAINPKIQKLAREDVKRAINLAANAEPTYDSLSDMHYLEKCINETLRKYPNSTTLQRACSKPFMIPDSNVTIPKGTSLQIPVHAIHWDDEIYPEPQIFDPERFSPEELANRHPMAFIPFGDGPRMCIGNRIGSLVTKLALAKILLRYEFEVDRSQTSIPIKFSPGSFVLAPLEKVVLKVQKIE